VSGFDHKVLVTDVTRSHIEQLTAAGVDVEEVR
jgi:hypothetical protein